MKTVIFFLLNLLAFAKPGTQQDFGSEAKHKRVTINVPNQLATSLYRAVLAKKQQIKGKNQFAILYLHANPADATPNYDNNRVRRVLTDPKSVETIKVDGNAHIWPPITATNIAVAGVAHGGPTGHTEYLLLGNLGNMLTAFRKKHGSCPSHIVIVSRLYPCYMIKYPPRTGCTPKIVSTFRKAKIKCKATQFVVGYDQIDPNYLNEWKEAEKEFQKYKIITTKV